MKANFQNIAAALLPLFFVASISIAQPTSDSTQAVNNESAGPQANSQAAALSDGNSKIRIVRLSEVKGSVSLDRSVGRGFENAMTNLPITEGAKIQTQSGLAEVEFEDNSTLRLAPETLVEFPRLELLRSGAKASTVRVIKGTVYVSLTGTKGNEFALAYGRQELALAPSAHVRLEMGPSDAKLSVLEGNVQVAQASGVETVGKKKTLTYDLASQSQPTLAKSVSPEDYDSWDKNAADYHKNFANTSAYGSSPYSYGISDMNYYGSFMNSGGCGSMWRPYLVSAAWDPFSNGAWAWYPSAGYSWVSPYPWGWMPYHYGSWAFCQGVGWGWQPGGSWMGLANASTGFNRRGGSLAPTPPSKPPAPGHPSMLAVNLKPIAASNLSSRETFVFRNDSAGLGIPRGSAIKLGRISNGVQQHGSVSMPISEQSFSYGSSGEANGRSTRAGQSSPANQRAGSQMGAQSSLPSPSSSSAGAYSGASAHGSAGAGRTR